MKILHQIIKFINIFIKNPNLKNEMDIITTGESQGKGVFEIFISHKDNKEYMAYPTGTEVIIADILERKNIRALDFKCIHNIKYYINQNNFKEYLMLVIYNGIKLFDINNNYNIINIEYKGWNKFSRYTMFLPENTNNEYLIASEYGWYYGEISYSSTIRTKLFSLNEKKIKIK